MLPHSPSDLRVIYECIAHPGVMAILADLRHIVNKLTDDLVMAESDREVAVIQGKIRAVKDIIDRYTRPQA